MKKVVSLLLVFVLCAGMCACDLSDVYDEMAENIITSGPTETTEQLTDATEETTRPTKPSKPTETPTQPTEPAKPTETPTQPTEPAKPTEAPTQPTEPAKPTEAPTQATEPPTEKPETKTQIYTKVNITAATDIVEGIYLLGGRSSYPIDDGSKYGFISGVFDSKGDRLICVAMAKEVKQVATGDRALIWKLIQGNGGFYVQNLGNGQYLYFGNNEKNAIFTTAKQSEAGVWKIVKHNDGWTLEEVASGRQLSLNTFGSAGSKYLAVAAYSSSGSTARYLDLYRLQDDTEPPPVETPTEKPTETPTEAPTTPPATGGVKSTYILNTNTKKYHDPKCSSAKRMSEENKKEVTMSKEELEAMGYKPCGICKP